MVAYLYSMLLEPILPTVAALNGFRSDKVW